MKDQDMKGKQQVQNKKVLLYKPYQVNSLRYKMPELIFIQEEIDNLEKYMKYMQVPVMTTLFYPLLYYKLLQPQGEYDKQYQKEISIVFPKKKHNTDTTRKGFPIEIYTEEPPYKPYYYKSKDLELF